MQSQEFFLAGKKLCLQISKNWVGFCELGASQSSVDLANLAKDGPKQVRNKDVAAEFSATKQKLKRLVFLF